MGYTLLHIAPNPPEASSRQGEFNGLKLAGLHRFPGRARAPRRRGRVNRATGPDRATRDRESNL